MRTVLFWYYELCGGARRGRRLSAQTSGRGQLFGILADDGTATSSSTLRPTAQCPSKKLYGLVLGALKGKPLEEATTESQVLN